jgi:integrase/recombinase XerD
MPLDDVTRIRARFTNELNNLQEADIDPEDRAAIRRFIESKDGDANINTLGQYITRCRICAERADMPLTEMELGDVLSFCFDLRHESDLAKSSAANYQQALRMFFISLGREWAEDVDAAASSATQKDIDPDEMLGVDEISALCDTAERLRDIAMIEFLADTGARLTMMASLRVSDVHLDEGRAYYQPNPNALGLKDAPQQPYPIIDAKASMRAYLRHGHPRPDNSDVAFFHKMKSYGGEDGSLGQTTIRHRLKTIGENSSVDNPVNPHNFRHSAISRMWREGYSKQQIQHRVAWKLDTNMWQRYVHLHAEDMNEQIFADAGVIDSSDGVEKQRHPCGNCRETLAPHHSFCPKCGEPATPAARGDMAAFRDELFDRATREPDEEIVDLLRDLNAALDTDPDTRRLVSGVLSE